MPTTILECFEARCPEYPGPHEEYMATASSNGTRNQLAPRVLIEAPLTHWLQPAEDFLQAEKSKGQASILMQEYVGSDEPCVVKLAVEQDVVRVASMYITLPLHWAMNARHSVPITIQSEYKSDGFRFDLSFNINQNTPNRRHIVLIEYKRVGMINYDDFPTVPQNEKLTQLTTLRNTMQRTMLDSKSSGYMLSKQAAAYARTSKCRFVALCDYDSLVLLEFESTDFVWVTKVPRDQIRKALLGFCLKACDTAKLPRK